MGISRSVLQRMGIGIACLALAACASGPKDVMPENPTWGKAHVVGQTLHLSKFDQSFRASLGDPNFDHHYIGCIEGCKELAEGGAPTRLVYVFAREHRKVIGLLGQTWDQVQKSSADPAFSLKFDAMITSPDCGPPRPQPCQALPICSDGCGRKPPGNCNSC